ncbi:MAG: glycosyltransferase [Candidatus Omnitrophota bacterium]
MNTDTPFFSVIIPSYNRERLLRKAIKSVLIQTFSDLELIVIDDGSTDNTSGVISSYNDTRLISIHQKNMGVSAARNRGIERSTGAFIAFLDSDDRWMPTKLERAKEYIANFPDVSVFHTEEVWYRNGNLLKQLKKHKKPSGSVYKNSLALCCIGISTAVIKKGVFSDIGIFDESLKACEDYDLWLRTANKYEVKLIPEYLTLKDGGRPDQLSARVWGLDRFRIKAMEKMLLSNELNDENYAATLEELKKKCKIFVEGAEKHGNTEAAEYYSNLPDKVKSLKV